MAVRLVFDIETDGLEQECKTIHSICTRDVDTGALGSYCDWMPDGTRKPVDDPTTIDAGVAALGRADYLIAHNAFKFDLSVLARLRGFHPKHGAEVVDTLVCTRLIWTDVDHRDHAAAKNGTFPSRLIGSHSLEAWGYRIGELKGEWGRKVATWEKWCPEMQAYCEQDTLVTLRLYQHIQAQNYSAEALLLEHDFARIIASMERRGFCFDEDKARSLYSRLAREREELAGKLGEVFPPKRVEVVSPKKKIRRVVEVPFNPDSRKQVAERLMEMGWKPARMTDGGVPQVDESVLDSLPYPEAKLLAKHFLLTKRIGQLAEGTQAWLRHVRGGRAFYTVDTNRAVTGRCAHRNFNIAQVPRVGSPYGKECRELFRASPGMNLVGADASGLELRALAGYLAHYDGGKYVETVLHGDVHTENQAAFGLPPGKAHRQLAKNGIYALIYGAGDEKLGATLERLADEHETAAQRMPIPGWARKAMGRDGPVDAIREQNWRRGAYARSRIENQLTGYGQLVRDVTAAAKARGWLRGLDGRKLRIRSAHSALNTLLQSAGAIVMKRATVVWVDSMRSSGYRWGEDYALVAHIHDEVQIECLPHVCKQAGELFVKSIEYAGQSFKFPCPLTGEYRIGATWADTH